jgi:hypothetical protein
MSLTFLCISTFFKGNEFLKSCKEAGNKVFLLTDKRLEHRPWLRAYIDTFFYIKQCEDGTYDMLEVINGLGYVMKENKIDRIVALDDFDVERAAYLREYFRIPGMGQTTSRYFRDKLAMRTKAQECGILVPGFAPIFNDAEIEKFILQYPGPWMIKPRSEASATGISKVETTEALWNTIYGLGDDRHAYLIEQYKPGDVYHIDSISYNERVIFMWKSKYLSPPFDVAHGGGIFRSITVEFDSAEDHALETMSVDLLKAFGLKHSASHTEIIRAKEDGKYYFLETSSRVGGAHIPEMVEACSGINLWKEWARMETAEAKGEVYKLPPMRKEYAGIVISLARQEFPNMEVFTDSEIVWQMEEPFHVGLVARSKNHEHLLSLLDKYAHIIEEQFHASAQVPDRSVH